MATLLFWLIVVPTVAGIVFGLLAVVFGGMASIIEAIRGKK